MSALKGKRIVITRPRAQADSLAAELSARGAQVILFPAIEIVPADPGPLDGALSRAANFAWIAFTSANAVSAVLDRAAALRIALPPSVRLAAVGRGTAQALADRGLRAAFVPTEFTGAALGRELPDVSGQRVLLPIARDARDDAAVALERRGAVVSRVVAYETRRAALDAAARRALAQGVDAFTFASPSAVEHGLGLLGGAIPDGAIVACIGPVTAEAARASGLSVAVEPADHTATGLVAALDAYFGSQSMVRERP